MFALADESAATPVKGRHSPTPLPTKLWRNREVNSQLLA